MSILFWGLTISMLGKVLVAVGVLLAHSELAHERRVDLLVLKSFRTERWLTILGLILIVIGYGLEVYFYGFTTLLTCEGVECAASLGNLLSE